MRGYCSSNCLIEGLLKHHRKDYFYEMQDPSNWGWGFLIIILSGIIAFVLAMTNSEIDQMELGALVNLFGPLFLLIVGLILYIFLCWLFQRKRWLTYSVGISLIIMFFGWGLHN